MKTRRVNDETRPSTNVTLLLRLARANDGLKASPLSTQHRRSAFFVNSTYVVSMLLIRNVVQETLTTGYLTIQAEEQLRQLLKTKYDLEDLNAFMTLQQAAMTGQVKQESLELRRNQQPIDRN